MEDNTYKIINRKGDVAYTETRFRPRRMEFNTKDQLLFFLHKNFKFPYHDHRPGADNPLKSYNKILSNCCHNWNDKYYTKEYVYKTCELTGVRRYDHTKTISNYFQYMILDKYDRIMNISDLEEKSFHFTEEVEMPPHRPYHGYYHNTNWKEKWARCEKRNKWVSGSYYRNVRVQQERRFAVDPEHKPYVRGKRNVHCLDPWNIEKHAVIQGTWKKVKIRKQWMENQNVCKTKSKNYRNFKL